MHFNKTVECSYLIAPVLIVLKRSILRSRSMILHKLTRYMESLLVFKTPIVMIRSKYTILLAFLSSYLFYLQYMISEIVLFAERKSSSTQLQSFLPGLVLLASEEPPMQGNSMFGTKCLQSHKMSAYHILKPYTEKVSA